MNPLHFSRANRPHAKRDWACRWIISLGLMLTSCLSEQQPSGYILPTLIPSATPRPTFVLAYPERPHYDPGQLVDYTAQSGDDLQALAVRFNTSAQDIRQANPVIPADATTLPAGLPLKIPVYYLPLWGPPYQILPDSLFPDGPAQIGFDTAAFIGQHNGWLKSFRQFAIDGDRSAAEIIDYIALEYSVSPRLLLALVEYQAGGLSLPDLPAELSDYPLGDKDYTHKGLYMQLNWAANTLNNTYYAYRQGQLTVFDHPDGRQERPDPWQNAATVAFQYYFSLNLPYDIYLHSVGEDGLAGVYRDLFGDPWQGKPGVDPHPNIPGSLQQPELRLPFPSGETWVYSGGPHAGWGDGEPLAAVDFAPPLVVGGCTPTNEYATAVADGVIARVEVGAAVLDLDGDGDEHTGWVIFYLHLANADKVTVGTHVKAGDPLGHPSCEGGRATGTHVHIARKYNGEWIPAQGTLAFDLSGWIARNGFAAYEGTLQRLDQTVTACTCSNPQSFITAGP